MKSIRKIFLAALCLMTTVAAFTQCAPSVEELTLEIPFKCNAYVTPLQHQRRLQPLQTTSLQTATRFQTMPR